MLFNAPQFLFGFLPVVLLGTALLGRMSAYRLAATWLGVASLAFYAWDRPRRLLPIILGSIVFNYLVARLLARAERRTALLWGGVGGNLALLFWFKYAGFVAANLVVFGLPVPALHIVLPIGISFFTFTQIAVLVDTARGEARVQSFRDYVLFVTFFPHLVAGPILHHKEIMPQFARRETWRIGWPGIAAGLSWFAAGLFKKVMLADGIAPYANATFKTAAEGGSLSTSDAWLGALGYTMQIYFDFSGYSDMAIGLALLFGVTFPLNFFSPYKAASLIEFWRRWHMTLSRFLRDYLYIPLGGSRNGRVRQMLNLGVTMLLGGLWHGAAWTFVLWGAIHGAGLVVNHLWRGAGLRLPGRLGHALTLAVVVLAWVAFRADTPEAAVRVWQAMLVPQAGSVAPLPGWAWVAVLSAIALIMPNTVEVFGWARRDGWQWRPSMLTASALGFAMAVAIAGSIAQPTSFLYFRF